MGLHRSGDTAKGRAAYEWGHRPKVGLQEWVYKPKVGLHRSEDTLNQYVPYIISLHLVFLYFSVLIFCCGATEGVAFVEYLAGILFRDYGYHL